jgi:hypothetical protein
MQINGYEYDRKSLCLDLRDGSWQLHLEDDHDFFRHNVLVYASHY